MGASTPSLAHTLESTPAEGSTPGTASSPVLAQSTPGSTLGSTPGLVQSTPGAGCTPALEASTPGVGSTPGLAPTPGRVSTHTPGSMRSSCLRRSTPSSQHASRPGTRCNARGIHTRLCPNTSEGVLAALAIHPSLGPESSFCEASGEERVSGVAFCVLRLTGIRCFL